jgi:hypothetical protein
VTVSAVGRGGARAARGAVGGTAMFLSPLHERERGSSGNGHRPGRAGSSVLRSAPSTLPELAETKRSSQTTLVEDSLENRKNIYKILIFAVLI